MSHVLSQYHDAALVTCSMHFTDKPEPPAAVVPPPPAAVLPPQAVTPPEAKGMILH